MPKPRKTVSETPGARFRRQVLDEFDLGVDMLTVLDAAAATMDTVAAIDAALVGEPLTVRGSAGQLREHPLLSEARQQRLALSRLLRQLALPMPSDWAEFRDAEKSRSARESARARWSA